MLSPSYTITQLPSFIKRREFEHSGKTLANQRENKSSNRLRQARRINTKENKTRVRGTDRSFVFAPLPTSDIVAYFCFLSVPRSIFPNCTSPNENIKLFAREHARPTRPQNNKSTPHKEHFLPIAKWHRPHAQLTGSLASRYEQRTRIERPGGWGAGWWSVCYSPGAFYAIYRGKHLLHFFFTTQNQHRMPHSFPTNDYNSN
jgi:hypothetical protein